MPKYKIEKTPMKNTKPHFCIKTKSRTELKEDGKNKVNELSRSKNKMIESERMFAMFYCNDT